MQWWVDPRRRRWFLWGILAISFLFVIVYRLSTAVIAEQLMAAFQTTGTQLGILHATFFVVYAVMQLPTGILVDRVGPRRTAATGAAVMNVGAIWFAFAQGYPTALVARFLIGLGGSVIFVSMLRFCANWYLPNEFTTMNGLCFSVGGFGGILATTPFALVVGRFGWQFTLVGLGVAGLVVAAAIAIFVRDSAEGAGLGTVAGMDRGPMLTFSEAKRATIRVIGDRWTWAVVILMFCATGINLTLFGLWGIPYVVQVYDTSVEFASLFTLLGGVGAVVGPPTIGAAAARFDRRMDLVVAGGIVYTLSMAVLAVLGDPPLIVVAIIFFLTGVLLGTFVLTYPIIKDRHSTRISGIALGTVNGAGFLGASLLPALMGFALDAFWTGEMVAGARVYTQTGYRVAFGIVTVMAAVTIGCALWMKTRRDLPEPEPGGPLERPP